MSRRERAHLMTALADAAHAEVGVGVSVAVLDEATGRAGGDMRTPLSLQTLEGEGLVRQTAAGIWSLTEAGVQRMRHEELSDR